MNLAAVFGAMCVKGTRARSHFQTRAFSGSQQSLEIVLVVPGSFVQLFRSHAVCLCRLIRLGY